MIASSASRSFSARLTSHSATEAAALNLSIVPSEGARLARTVSSVTIPSWPCVGLSAAYSRSVSEASRLTSSPPCRCRPMYRRGAPDLTSHVIRQPYPYLAEATASRPLRRLLPAETAIWPGPSGGAARPLRRSPNDLLDGRRGRRVEGALAAGQTVGHGVDDADADTGNLE